MIEKINRINKAFVKKAVSAAKADVLEEFFDAYRNEVKWCEENKKDVHHDEIIYSLQEQMWAFYYQKAEEAEKEMRAK